MDKFVQRLRRRARNGQLSSGELNDLLGLGKNRGGISATEYTYIKEAMPKKRRGKKKTHIMTWDGEIKVK